MPEVVLSRLFKLKTNIFPFQASKSTQIQDQDKIEEEEEAEEEVEEVAKKLPE
jgi:hypothetical protein